MTTFNRSVIDIQNLIHQIHKTSDVEPFKAHNFTPVLNPSIRYHITIRKTSIWEILRTELYFSLHARREN